LAKEEIELKYRRNGSVLEFESGYNVEILNFLKDSFNFRLVHLIPTNLFKPKSNIFKWVFY
jgi:hypothetical protein